MDSRAREFVEWQIPSWRVRKHVDDKEVKHNKMSAKRTKREAQVVETNEGVYQDRKEIDCVRSAGVFI